MGLPRKKASSGQGCGFLVYSSDHAPTVKEGKDNTRKEGHGCAMLHQLLLCLALGFCVLGCTDKREKLRAGEL